MRKILAVSLFVLNFLTLQVSCAGETIEIPLYTKKDDDGLFTRYFINMTFGTYP
jgi:hypothetical protein